jgi:hypothetical protein
MFLDIIKKLNDENFISHVKERIEYQANDDLKAYMSDRRLWVKDIKVVDGHGTFDFIINYDIGSNVSNNTNWFSVKEFAFVDPGIGSREIKIERRYIKYGIVYETLQHMYPGCETDIIMMHIDQIISMVKKDAKEFIDKNLEVYGIDRSIRDNVYEVDRKKPNVNWIMKFRRDDE